MFPRFEMLENIFPSQQNPSQFDVCWHYTGKLWASLYTCTMPTGENITVQYYYCYYNKTMGHLKENKISHKDSCFILLWQLWHGVVSKTIFIIENICIGHTHTHTPVSGLLLIALMIGSFLWQGWSLWNFLHSICFCVERARGQFHYGRLPQLSFSSKLQKQHKYTLCKDISIRSVFSYFLSLILNVHETCKAKYMTLTYSTSQKFGNTHSLFFQYL